MTVVRTSPCTPTPARPTRTVAPRRNLQYGSRGRDVRALQSKLRSAGHDIKADGIFGPRTQRAVRAYQQANSLKVDGIVGPQTRRSLTSPAGTVPGETPAPAGRTTSGGTPRAAAFDRVLGGALRGQGQVFIDAANKYGLDPRLLAAISMHETGNGTSRFARELNNVGGIMDPKQNWQRGKRFGSLAAGIDYMARNLKRNYIDKGLTSLDQIQRKYAPVGARNDPRGQNRHWVGGVQRFLRQLGG